MANLAAVVEAFVEQRLGGEAIERLPLTDEQRVAPKADYLLFGRAVIVEMKELRDDREARIQTAVNRRRRQPDWPYYPVEVDIDTFLRLYRRASEFRAELYEAGTASIEECYRKANRQVRATRQTFSLPDALGVLFLVNERTDLLDPKVIASKVAALNRKCNRDKGKCFESIDLVVYLSAAHFVVRPEGPPRPLVMSLIVGPSDRYGVARELAHLISREWSAFLGLPLEESSEPTEEGFASLQIEGRRSPSVF